MDRPEDLPNRLECSYCKRCIKHGGECFGKSHNRNEEGCLYFKMDEKGCIRNADLSIPFSLFSDIPPLGMWKDGWLIYKQSTEIRINKIYSLSWNERKGVLYVKCNYDYYINEFCEGYKNISNKANLKIIK